MDSKFEISLNMKTCKGIETYGCFNLGKDEQFARSLFDGLLGDDKVNEDSVITIDLIKRENQIPYPQKLRHCSYAQLAENIKIITKELFKQLNLHTQ